MSNNLFITISGLLSLYLTGFSQVKQPETYPKAIEDNSYFLEEAYNQEDRVVQHINNGNYTHGSSHDFEYAFTQEWPVFSQKHQFSYTLGFASLNSGNINGLNDIMLNYRYQLTGHDDFFTIAPRFSLIIPTGNQNKGLGNGVLGYQSNIAMSKRVSNKLVCHANIGYTFLPNVETADFNNEVHKNIHSNINFGASAIWLVTSNTNLMLEVLHNISREANTNNKMVSAGETIISPGFRHAIDIKSLQIVPGIAVPINIHDNKADLGAFFYLSFEHPF